MQGSSAGPRLPWAEANTIATDGSLTMPQQCLCAAGGLHDGACALDSAICASMWAHRSATEQRSCLGNAPTNPGVLADEASNEGEAVAVCSDGVVARESVGEHPCSR
jgi:hypothetical protein